MSTFYNPNPAPPPQLSKADLVNMTPDEIAAADQAGQFTAVKDGRTPTDTERRGERWATKDERAAQAASDAETARIARTAYRTTLIQQNKETNR